MDKSGRLSGTGTISLAPSFPKTTVDIQVDQLFMSTMSPTNPDTKDRLLADFHLSAQNLLTVGSVYIGLTVKPP